MRRTQTRYAAIAATLLAIGWTTPGAAQPKPEGYDPLRQITKQLVKANLLIVLDTTGSMSGDAPGNNLLDGDDATGRLSWWRSGPVNTYNPRSPSDGNNRNIDPGLDVMITGTT